MRALPLVLVLIVTVLVFGQVLTGELLLWDDDVFLYRNPHLKPPTWQSVRAAWTEPYADLYVPVASTVWIALARAGGGVDATVGSWWVKPWVYHAASLVVHLAAVGLAYLLLVWLTGSPWGAAAGAALFALHPVQVETVAWASELKDLLGSCLGLLALVLLLAGRRAPRRRRWTYAGATLAFVLALLSKPNLVVLPLLAMLIETGLQGVPLRQSARTMAPWLALAAAYTALTCRFQPPYPDLVLPLWQRPFVAGDALAFYLGKLVWPARLAADYGRMPGVIVTHWWAYATWLAPAAVLAAALYWRRQSRWALPALLWFALALLPVLGLVPFHFQRYSTVADHYAYLALFGPALALAGLARHAGRSLPRAGIVLGLAALATLSGLQTINWQSNIIFWQHVITVNPHSFPAHTNLGTVYDMLGRFPEAAAEYAAAVALKPTDETAQYKLGMVRVDLRQYAEARGPLEQVVALNPGHMEARQTLADVAAALGDDKAAVTQLRVVVAAEPGNERARQQLSEALARLAKRAP